MGYFVSKLGRENVIVLYLSDNEEFGEIELPSDIYGVLYIHFNEEGSWKEKIVQELIDTGFDVD